jgi:Lamin Tail Domain
MSGKRIPFAGLVLLVAIFLLLITSLTLPDLARITGATPGPYLSLALKAPLTPSPTTTLTPTPPYGILLISEVMVRPAVTEPDGEWVELFNAGGGTINLAAYKLGDEETRGQGEGMLQFPAGYSLAPGQVIVVANKAASFHIAYGFYPDFEMNASSPMVPDMRKALS